MASVWIGLVASYTIPAMPPSFAILTVATLTYPGALATTRQSRRGRAATTITADTDTA